MEFSLQFFLYSSFSSADFHMLIMDEANTSAAEAQRSAEPTIQCERDVLFIHPSEHSSLALTTSPLNGTKFLAWLRVVYVSLDIVESFVFCATSRDLWLAIQARYGRSNGPMVYKLQREISSVSQNDLSLTAYLKKVTKLWNELSALAPVPKCRCGDCSCGINKAIDDLTSSTQVMQFLMGLHDSFNNDRSQILMLDPLPDIEKTFSMVYSIGEQGLVQNDLEINSTDMACQLDLNDNRRSTDRLMQQKKSFVDKRNLLCTHCSKKGHARDNCFQLHGNTVITTETDDNCWIVDSGASNHVCANIALFHSFIKSASPHYIHLADGSKRLVQYTGTVKLTSNITLENVLSIPQFSVNLISSDEPSLPMPTVTLQSDNILDASSQPATLTEQDDLLASNPVHVPRVTDSINPKPPPLRRFQRQTHKPSWLNDFEPKTYLEAVKHVEWQDAMKAELNALERNCTWTLAPLHKGNNPETGFNQISGVDYNDNFSPMAKTVTVRLFLAIAAAHGWPLQQVDVNNVFLHGYLNEDLYMTPPEGYAITLCLISLLVYVDDILVTAPTLGLIQSVKDYLHSLFTIKDLGEARYFLGLEISSSSDGLYVAQNKDALVSWKTKKQTTVCRSITEAEYRSIAAMAALHIMANPVFHERTKHIELDCHLVRDAYKDGFISPSFVRCSAQLADIFTKALDSVAVAIHSSAYLDEEDDAVLDAG
ncbi:hypothetical protein Sango_1880900 [Sesamum angolense]|uniref:Uncharacterized protein n=1 Tax=Sesamum angolense TaxID=2727404 RepID=A0AAE2BQJ3_9LAMI|nr:hypothetical protein Sango_1880900 [Sesamum angolense]